MFNFNLNDSWKSFLNQNSKWSVGVFIRVGTIILLCVATLYLLKMLQLKDFFGEPYQDSLDIHTIKIINESQQSKLDSKKDVDDIRNLLDIMDKIKNEKNLR